QPVEQIVGFYAVAFAAADEDVGLLRVFFGNFVAQLSRATRREGHQAVSKMLQAAGLLRVSERVQAGYDYLLGINLARIDHGEDIVGVAERGRAGIVAVTGGNPGFVAIGMGVKTAVVKIAAEQSEFPEVVGDVFSDVGDGAVGAYDDFCVDQLLVFFFGFGG